MRLDVFDVFCRELQKTAGTPQDHVARPEVPGLKVPRLATPRLNPEVGTHMPSNPFRGNWTKMTAKVAAKLSPGEAKALGAVLMASGLYSLKRTKDQLSDPRPGGGAGGSVGAVVRTGMSAGRGLGLLGQAAEQ